MSNLDLYSISFAIPSCPVWVYAESTLELSHLGLWKWGSWSVDQSLPISFQSLPDLCTRGIPHVPSPTRRFGMAMVHGVVMSGLTRKNKERSWMDIIAKWFVTNTNCGDCPSHPSANQRCSTKSNSFGFMMWSDDSAKHWWLGWGTCGRMNRAIDSFERSIFSDKTEAPTLLSRSGWLL